MAPENPELQLADDFVEQTGCNIYLTGRAGTGKTTFLHRLKEKSAKRMIVTAPTGVAAINAGGVTLHSFFQLPFGPYVPGYGFSDQERQRRFNKEKINIIKSLDLLVIDEISMVRADLLDGVDEVLRRYRQGNLPFGGVQLLMIGDLHQLPPVVKNDDWAILGDHYRSPYFFNSQALNQTELVVIELRHIYRQSDSEFINLLNRVRENCLDTVDLDRLNSRCLPDYKPQDKQNVITLCTHNNRADSINRARLQKLQGDAHSFKAEISGDFPEYSFPTSGRLDLKKDAQVMFVRNDPGPDKLYYNGKIGKISRISKRSIVVRCPGDRDDIVVEPITWENIRYTLDPETKEINKNKIGEFVQYPLKPAWAITIHKSQGLTFERAIIDAGAAFAHGQVYVALSRCKSFDGMVLKTPISPDAVKTDPLIGEFTRQALENQPTNEKLEQAKVSFQQRLLLQCYDYRQMCLFLQRFAGLLSGSGSLLQVSGGDIQSITEQAQSALCMVGENFIRQLQGMLTETTLPESDSTIIERVTKASVYFQEKLETLANSIDGLQLETDNKELHKRIKKSREQLRKEIEIRRAAALSCRQGFSPSRYLHGIASAEVDFKPAKEKKSVGVVYTKDDVEHPELFQRLRDWRSKKAGEAGLPHYRIMHQRILIQIAVTLPDNERELLKIPGMGPRTIEKYGVELTAMVSAYRQEQGEGPDR